MIGELALVPPTVPQPLKQVPSSCCTALQLLSYTDTPVFGSATALTSATVRFAHAPLGSHDCRASCVEQPLPAPLHADSVKPRELLARVSVVPPTAVT